MELFLEALKEYNGIIGMTSVFILAIIILLTLKSIQKQQKEQLQPYVVLYLTKLQHDEGVNYFVLENFGRKAALNISVHMNPALKIEFPKDNIFPLFFDHRIGVLAPSQRIVTALPSGDYMDQRYDCTIIYRNDENEVFTRKQSIDFNFTKYLLFSTSSQSKIARNTDKITQLLEDMSNIPVRE